MKTMLRAILLLLIAVIVGCDPEQLVVWSPDGSKAAVIGPDGLHIADPGGKLTPLLVKDVRKIAWFADSHRVAAVREVNTRLATRKWRPVLYLKRHHDHREIWPFYRYADFCMVTSLHDGMNLVAKEFVSVREDGGALILSQFTGASAELRDALLVNPYDLDGVADAIRRAVEMPREEQAARMGRMHQQVREQNIYRWAGLLLAELSRIPEEAQQGDVAGGGSAAPSPRSGRGIVD